MGKGDRQVEEGTARCPFLEASADSTSHICLARPGDRLVISARYADTYCLTAKHAYCSLFLQAKSAPRQAAPSAGAHDQEAAVGEKRGAEQTLVIPTIRRAAEPAPAERRASEVETVRRERTPKAAPTITRPTHHSSITTDTVTISGTGEAGSEIALFDWQEVVGRTEADARGRWRITLTSVTPGSHMYRARAVDTESGDMSPPSSLCSIVVEPPVSSQDDHGDGGTRKSRRAFTGSRLAGKLLHREGDGAPAPEQASPERRSGGTTSSGQTGAPEPEPAVPRTMQQRVEKIEPLAFTRPRPEHAPHDAMVSEVLQPERIRHTEARPETELYPTPEREMPPATLPAREMTPESAAPRAAETEPEDRGKQGRSQLLPGVVEAEVIEAEPVETIPVQVVARKVDEAAVAEVSILPTGQEAEPNLRTAEPQPVAPEPVAPEVPSQDAEQLKADSQVTPQVTSRAVEVAPDVRSQDAVQHQALEAAGPEARDAAATTQLIRTPPKRDEAVEADPAPTIALPTRDVDALSAADRAAPTILLKPTDIAPAPAVPAPPPQKETARRLPIAALAGIAGAAALIALIIVFAVLFLARPGKPAAVPRSHPAEGVTTPAPAPSWTFTPLQVPADEVMLILSNANKFPVHVRINLAGKEAAPTQSVDIPASNGAELPLAPQTGTNTITVKASAPILVQRFVTRHGQVQSAPGKAGP